MSEYDKALQQDLSDGFRDVVSRQRTAIVSARVEVAVLQARA